MDISILSDVYSLRNYDDWVWAKCDMMCFTYFKHFLDV